MSIVFPSALYLTDGSSIREFDEETFEEIERDPRGILHMWSPPQKGVKYVMGMDPSEGITGWSRATRTDDDFKTDNGAIEVFQIDAIRELCWKEENGKRVPEIDKHTRQQKVKYKDLQVAEFFAPCDAVEIARVANIIGRIYAGDEEDQCELIWEGWPGCGMLTTQELLRLGYGNLWHWEYIADVAEETARLGWRSTRESTKLLWYRSRRHLMQKNVVIRSKWLLAEYTNAEVDVDKMRARASFGYHDDLMTAADLALWAGHKWRYDSDNDRMAVSEAPTPFDFQNRAPVLGEEGTTYVDWRSSALADWE